MQMFHIMQEKKKKKPTKPEAKLQVIYESKFLESWSVIVCNVY